MRTARKHVQRAKRNLAAAVRTAVEWLRDLTEEGIEPHPGPRYLSKNINSVHGKGKLYTMLKKIRNESTRTPITAAFIQDHRLSSTRAAEIESLARGMKMLAITAHAPPHPRTRICYGGTMIVRPHESIELENDETMQDACDRIKATKKAAAKGRYLSASMKVEKDTRKLTSRRVRARHTSKPPCFLHATRPTAHT